METGEGRPPIVSMLILLMSLTMILHAAQMPAPVPPPTCVCRKGCERACGGGGAALIH